MVRILISLLLTLLMLLYSGIAGSGARLVRSLEDTFAKYPETPVNTQKVFADDTGADFVTDPEWELSAETWVCREITLQSTKTYADPFTDVDVDMVLVGSGVKYTIPGFWDGGNTWKIRFICPSAGEWKFKTFCTDESNTGLHGRTGKVTCTAYSGDLDIYRHGFVTAAYCKKYFTYADGTPFFYLGDTHWSLGDETQDMVRTIAEKRAAQGFTVIQSEPIGAGFSLENGVDSGDLSGFADYDAKFRIIAEAGLTHANAEFFFPASMEPLLANFGGCAADGTLSENAKAYLEKLSRYWVARYGAYPVLWTLGQEVDNDFYWREDNHPAWNSVNNPYKLVADYIYKYDAYSHPLTAHQENVHSTGVYGNGKQTGEKRKVYHDSAEPSVFRNVFAHNWFAVQWSPSLTKGSDQKIEKDCWYNAQGKPVINYEGRYCYLWTKNFGSRMQGWASYLSGMYGYGWGAHDTWSYLNIYDEENDSGDGVDTITSAEKINATWLDALEYPSAYQMGHTKTFFTSFDWWNLIPRFDNILYLNRSNGAYAYMASNKDNSEIVIYFYNFSDKTLAESPNSPKSGTKTGMLGSLLPNTVYKYKWFDPLTGEFSEEKEFTSTAFGTYRIGEKQWNGQTVGRDMVFYCVQK